MYFLTVLLFALSFFTNSAEARVVYPHEIRAEKLAGATAWYDTISTDKFAMIATDGINGSDWWGRINHFSPDNWRNPLKIGGAQRVYGVVKSARKLRRFQKVAFSVVFVDSCAGAYVFAMKGDTLSWQLAKKIVAFFPEVHRQSRVLWGRSDFDLDGRDNTFILAYPFADSTNNVNSFVLPQDQLPLWLPSNGVEVLHINTRHIKSDLDCRRVLAHEFQHVIALSWDFYESAWIQEGMAVLSARLVNGVESRYVEEYWNYKDILGEWQYDDEHYASAYYFFSWLHRVYGMDTVVKIMRDPHNGRESVASALGESWDVVWGLYVAFLRSDGSLDLALEDKPAPNEEVTNTPNPYNPSTVISFSVNTPGQAKMAVYNAIGQLVSELYDGSVEAGLFQIVWDGSSAASGVYFVRVVVDGQVKTHRTMLLK